jgi:L-alanine-DL-glutamate epimerase-like enolase superfamily enzyme
VLNRVMDAAVRGHLAGKAVIDMAMWDLRGKLLDQPVSILLGGVHQKTYPVFYPISLGTPEEMGRDAAYACARGYRRWQVKLGEDPVADAERLQAVSEAIGDHNDFLTADANTTWSLAPTCQFLISIGNRYTFIEQPCPGLWELSQVRNRTPLPVIADEAICDLRDLVSCIELCAADAINIKITRVGGLTKATWLRDVAQAMGLMLMVDEPMGAILPRQRSPISQRVVGPSPSLRPRISQSFRREHLYRQEERGEREAGLMFQVVPAWELR